MAISAARRGAIPPFIVMEVMRAADARVAAGEDVPRGAKRVGDDDVGAGADVILMRRANRVGVRQHRRRAPRQAVHGHAAALELGAHRTVEDYDVASVEPLLQCHFRPRLGPRSVLERVKADRNQFDRDYFAPWPGALRNAMREHRISSATTPRGKRTRPAVGHIGSSAALRRSPDAFASRVGPRLAE